MRWPSAVLAVAVLFLAMSGASAQSADKFTLFGTAKKTVDPTNAPNFVVSIDTSLTATFGGITRRLGVTVAELDGRLVADYYLADRSCGGGSPRIQLAIDANGDGASDGNAFGYFGPPPNFVGCPQNAWVRSDNLTDRQARWDISQLGGGGVYLTWDQVETFFAARPDHKVLTASLVDDSAWFPAAAGVAYFDNLTIFDSILKNASDVQGN